MLAVIQQQLDVINTTVMLILETVVHWDEAGKTTARFFLPAVLQQSKSGWRKCIRPSHDVHIITVVSNLTAYAEDRV